MGYHMEIKQERDGEKVTLHVSGRIDTQTSPQLEEVVLGILDGVKELVFDLSETAYVSSAGLRIFLIAQKRMARQGVMKIAGANSDLLDIFEVTGFTSILTFV